MNGLSFLLCQFSGFACRPEHERSPQRRPVAIEPEAHEVQEATDFRAVVLDVVEQKDLPLRVQLQPEAIPQECIDLVKHPAQPALVAVEENHIVHVPVVSLRAKDFLHIMVEFRQVEVCKPLAGIESDRNTPVLPVGVHDGQQDIQKPFIVNELSEFVLQDFVRYAIEILVDIQFHAVFAVLRVPLDKALDVLLAASRTLPPFGSLLAASLRTVQLVYTACRASARYGSVGALVHGAHEDRLQYIDNHVVNNLLAHGRHDDGSLFSPHAVIDCLWKMFVIIKVRRIVHQFWLQFFLMLSEVLCFAVFPFVAALVQSGVAYC